MKKLVFLIVIILSAGFVFGQQTKEERKAARKARKAEQHKIAMENSQRLKAIVESKMFVLEAHTLFDRGGLTYNLNKTTNFVGFDGKNSTVQLAFDGLIGWNGIGGVTIDGTISQLEIVGKEDKPEFSVNVTVNNKVGGLVTMVFRISSDGSSRVDLSGSFGQRLSFQGYIVALSESRVYKGRPNY